MASNPEDVIARLTAALHGVMEFAAGALGTAACHGDKCRLAWCESCYGEEYAAEAVERALVAYRQAEAALTAAQATPPASPEPPERIREAFRAGFLAVCKRKGDTEPIDILTRVWSFDGIAAADLEPEAFEAWRSASPVPVAPQTNLLGDHRCFRCGQDCDCAQPSDCQMCSRCYKEIQDEGPEWVPPAAKER